MTLHGDPATVIENFEVRTGNPGSSSCISKEYIDGLEVWEIISQVSLAMYVHEAEAECL